MRDLLGLGEQEVAVRRAGAGGSERGSRAARARRVRLVLLAAAASGLAPAPRRADVLAVNRLPLPPLALRGGRRAGDEG